MSCTIVLDVSRLLRAAWSETPSGIERVEFAYAQEFRSQAATMFIAANIFGQLRVLPRHAVIAYLDRVETSWKTGSRRERHKIKLSAIYLNLFILVRCFPIPGFRPPRPPVQEVYLNVAHENLCNRRALARFKARTSARLVFFIHDLIPILYPEYVKPKQAAYHRRRIDTVAALADTIIVNSAATGDALMIYLGRPDHPRIHNLPLGVAPPTTPLAPALLPGRPYFLCIATIEPRKNHLLLLHLWRGLAQTSENIPGLIVIGRRGWENEMVLDMLERCTLLHGLVEERAGVSDAELDQLMQGARALLLPSFAEGFGLPVPEALRAGTPVLCSDLAALREAGGDVPEYLDPTDGPLWRQAILDYADPASPRRAEQLARLAAWSPPRWEDHFSRLHAIIAALPEVPG
jgi:glycosyltransferase involved in cell wall biosynthesis